MIDLFYLVIGIGFVFSLMVQGWLRNTYSKWSRVRNSANLPGAVVARHLLDKNGLAEVQVTIQQGSLTDHYDPRSKTVCLSERIFRDASVASAAVAAHETGHALQDQKGYSLMRLRNALLPLAQLGAQYGPWAVVGGYSFGSAIIVQVGFLIFAASLLFQLLTLPVEFDASRRARLQLEEMGLSSEQDLVGTRKVLRAAAMTYVAGAATAMGQLVVILLFAGRGLLRRLFTSPK